MPRKDKTTDLLEMSVSNKVNEGRMMRGFTAQDLGKKINVTHQQTLKYINGSNRITAGRLYNISRALNLPISYFFAKDDEEMDATRTLTLKVMKGFSKLNIFQKEYVNNLIKILLEKRNG